ncbi:NeuD/PglB/VioB family sugar acetyltransferase [Nesterenkonia aurantiaca]|uniref:NeuD/PglB/VioB family sugar acetyltransferase n=1 Tax=Nesterenkonia aurantiaca TaxID=1436010 RepID=UPI003EE5B871
MKSRIVIAGAGGFGRGVYDWLQDTLYARGTAHATDVVFIDDSTPVVRPQAQVVSTIADYQPLPQDEVICAIAKPEFRREIIESLQRKEARFHVFVDHRAMIGSRVLIGEGSVICPGTVLDADATIGAHVHVNSNCFVGHDSVLSDYTTLSPAVNVMGEVTVGVGSFLGGSAVVLPRTSVGEWSILGAGAVLVHGSAPRTVMVGNPARATRSNGA